MSEQTKDEWALENCEKGQGSATWTMLEGRPTSTVEATIRADQTLAQILRRERESVKELEAQVAVMREALEEIKLGRGAFSRDPHQHATNTIEAMKAEAIEALSSDAGRVHLDLDALKDMVVKASRNLSETCASASLLDALKALEAKEKENAK